MNGKGGGGGGIENKENIEKDLERNRQLVWVIIVRVLKKGAWGIGDVEIKQGK